MTTSTDLKTFKIAKGTKAQIITAYNNGDIGDTDFAIATDETYSSRNIGEIVASTLPLTDAGLHLLDGALISGSGSYADFVSYIAGLISDYPDLFETEANWQTAVTTYGVCGKFVYDSVNNTIRLPKITGFVEGTIDPTVLGDLVEAGLPNITGEFFVGCIQYKNGNDYGGPYSGAFTRSNNNGVQGASYTARGATYSFNASNSNSTYGNSSTVQPQAIKVLYYIVMANSVKTEIEVDIDQVMTDVNAFNISKANINMDNISSVGKETVIGWGMPDYSTAVSVTTNTYTAPYDGIITGYIEFGNTSTETDVTVNGEKISFIRGWTGNYAGTTNNVFFTLSRGDVVVGLHPTGLGVMSYVVFSKLKGAN